MNILGIGALILVMAAFQSGCGAGAADDRSEIESIFESMEQALRNSDEAAFKSRWHPEGYNANLVGGSGLEGSSVFRQGSRKGWYLKPDFSKMKKLEGVFIVPCDIWSWERNKSVDAVDAAVVQQDQKWVILGAGEDSQQVAALAQRFINGSSLPPAK